MNLDIDIVGKFAQFQDSLNQVSRSAQKMQTDLSAGTAFLKGAFQALAATLTVGAFAQVIKSAVDLGDEFNDLGTRTGLTAQQLLTLKFSADRSGSSLEGLNTLASKLPKVMKDAGDQTSYTARALVQMGVDPKKGFTDLYDYLLKVGQGLSGMNDGAKKSLIAIATLGKGGDQLIGLVQGIAEAEERMRRLGITMSEDFKQRADAFNDSLSDLADLSKHSARELAVGLLPALQNIVEAFIEFKKEGSGFAEIGKVIGEVLTEAASAAISTAQEVESLWHVFKNLRDLVALPWSNESYAQLAQRMQADADKIADKYRKLQETLRNGAGAEGGGDKPPRNNGLADLVTDEERRAAEAAAKAKEKLEETITKITLDQEKARAQAQQSILDARYAQGLVSDQDYYDQRRLIADEALAAETAAVESQIQRQAAELQKAAAGTKDYYEAERKLRESVAKRDTLQAAGANRAELDDLARARAADEYANAIQRVNAQILRLQGDSGRAAAIDFAQQYEAMIRKAELAGDTGRLGSIRVLQQLTVAQAQYNDLQQQSQNIESTLAAEELRIRTSQEVGAISELEALRQTGEARQRAVPQLEAIAEAMRRVAQESGNPKLLSDADTFAAKLDQLAKQADTFSLKVSGIFTDNFAQALTDFATGAKSAADAFKSFATSVLNELVRLEAQALASSLFGKNGGIGSLFSGLFSGKSDVTASQGYLDVVDLAVGGGGGAAKAVRARQTGGSVSGDVNVIQNITLGTGVTRADVLSGMAVAQSSAEKSIREQIRRGQLSTV